MFLQNRVERKEVSGPWITWPHFIQANSLTFILTLFRTTDSRHDRGGRSCGGRVVGRGAFELFGLQLCVDPQALQSFRGEISLQHRCLFVTVVQPKGYVPVSSGPWSTQVHQAQFVSVRGISLILRVHFLSETYKRQFNIEDSWQTKTGSKLFLELYVAQGLAMNRPRTSKLTGWSKGQICTSST